MTGLESHSHFSFAHRAEIGSLSGKVTRSLRVSLECELFRSPSTTMGTRCGSLEWVLASWAILIILVIVNKR
jgi:hypothetical protein